MAGQGPQRIGEILPRLIAKQGLGRPIAAGELEDAWRTVVGDATAAVTRVGSLSRKSLEVIVSNSVYAQEILFQQAAILTKIRRILPHIEVDRLRCRVGSLE